MASDLSQKELLILKVLRATGEPLASSRIVEELMSLGYEMSERTIRAYLQELDKKGFTENLGKRGRRITPAGIRELDSARVIERVGFLSAKIENLTYLMDFDLQSKSGSVVVNISLVDPKDLYRYLDSFCKVFEKGYGMGTLVGLFEPGYKFGHLEVPEGKVGVATVCSITLNGVLLKFGIPTISRFGGLLELIDGAAARFVEVIYYDATTIDPLEVFIKSGMTDYLGAINGGNGRIGASFREFPANSRNMVIELAKRLEKTGLGGFMKIGLPGRQLLDIPVNEGMVGAVVIGGLNPVAVLEEHGCKTNSRALAGLVEYTQIFPYWELEERLKEIL